MPEFVPEVTRVEVAGRRLRLTSLDKVMYPSTETTKGEVLAYYAQVAPLLLPHVANRPVTRVRWPESTSADEASLTKAVEDAAAAATVSLTTERLSASLENAEREHLLGSNLHEPKRDGKATENGENGAILSAIPVLDTLGEPVETLAVELEPVEK